MNRIILIFLGCSLLLVTSCASHFDRGMDAYQKKNYPKAVEELSQVENKDPNFTTAQHTLWKAEFKLAVDALKNSVDAQAGVKNLNKVVGLALKLNTKEAMEETFQVVLQQLKTAKDPAYVKALLAQMITIAKENKEVVKVAEVLKELIFKIKDFLFDSDMRSTITDAIGEIRNIARQ